MIQFKRFLLLFVLLICVLVCDAGAAQEVRVSSNTAVGYGWRPWYEVHVDPDNPRNMILCGSRLNAKVNAFKTFVDYSADGGKTWVQTFDDKSGDWDGEQSCAYGVHGVAYLVSDATKVINDEMHHGLGTARIYVSHDAGKTWNLCIRTGWTDASTSVVDTNPGPNQNRLYIFFNAPWTFYSSVGNKSGMDSEDRSSNSSARIGMISYKDGDAIVAGPFSNDQMFSGDQGATKRYRGAYPGPAILLKDGSILSFFHTQERTAKNERGQVEAVVRINADRTGLDSSIKVFDSVDGPEPLPNAECGSGSLSSASTYDAANDKIYDAYASTRNGKCALFLTSSNDGGKSWSTGQAVWANDPAVSHTYRSLAIAVGTNGELGVLWQDALRSGCWKFAVFADGGKSLSAPQNLGTCSAVDATPSALDTAYLWTSFFQADPKRPGSAIRIGLRNTRNDVQRDAHALVATPDGTFHAVWIDAGNGGGELRTAVIQVTSVDTLISQEAIGLEDVTSKTVLLYGGDQGYDPKTRIVTLDVVLRNDGKEPLKTPIKLAVSRGGESEVADIANADNGVSTEGAVWDLSPSVPGGTLAPGATTKPFTLKFNHLANPDAPRGFGDDDLLGLGVNVYASK